MGVGGQGGQSKGKNELMNLSYRQVLPPQEQHLQEDICVPFTVSLIHIVRVQNLVQMGRLMSAGG